jgi:hypothetical protein
VFKNHDRSEVMERVREFLRQSVEQGEPS